LENEEGKELGCDLSREVELLCYCFLPH